MKFMKASALLAVLTLVAFAAAKDQGEIVGRPWKGAKGITETVSQIMARKAPIAPMGTIPKEDDGEEEGMGTLQPNPLATPESVFPPRTGIPGGDKTSGPHFAVGVSWLGGTINDSGFIPPDTEGAVGPTQVLMCINGRIRVFDKQGNLGPLNTTTNSFFTSVRNGSTTSDPRVRYDRVTQKFYIVMINVSQPNRIMLAVSSGPTITGTSSFTFFQFQQNTVAPAGDAGALFDYPSLGIDKDALYIGGNLFGGSGAGSAIFVVNKASIQGAGPITVTVFRRINGTSQNTPMGVENDDPNSTQGYVIGTTPGVSGSLRLFRITNPGTTPILSSPIDFNVLSTASPNSIPAQGSAAALDSIDTRLIGAQLRTNTLTGAQTLWTAHQIRINSSGTASTSGDRVGVRWYQLQNIPSGTPSMVQAGTVFDSSANVERRWFGSATMSGQGHALIGSSAAGPSRQVAAVANYRLSSDALGTTTEQTVVNGGGAYNVESSAPQRWGDYSHTIVDPNDNMTLWSLQEYCSAADTWAIRIFSVLAPPPATITAAAPSVLTPGNTYTITVTGTSVNGSGFYDPGAAFPNHLSATVSGTGVTVNSATFNSPTQVTLNVTVSAGAATGPRDLTITNPDGQSTTGTATLTVANASQTVAPTSFTAFRGNFVSGTVADVAASDNSYLRYQPGPVATGTESPIDLTFTGTTTLLAPSSMTVRLETRASSPNIEQRVRLFNFVTNAFEDVNTSNLATTDNVLDIVISSNAARFVSATGEVRARVTYKQVGPVVSLPWTVSIDQLNWIINP